MQTNENPEPLHPLFYRLGHRQKIMVQVLVFLCILSVAIGQTIVFTVLQPIGRELGLSAVHTGLIIVGSSIIFATGSNVWGRQSERWGRKAIILLGLLGYSLGTLLFTGVFYLGFEGVLAGTSLLICLTLARMLQSTLMSATPPSASAYIADITDTTTRTPAMARVGSAHSLGTILGPASAGLLAGFALLAPLYFAAVLPLVAAILCWFFLPATKIERNNRKDIPKVSYFDKRTRRFVFIGIFLFIAYGSMNMTLGFYIQDLMSLSATDTIKMLGKLAAISALASVSSQLGLASYLKLTPLLLIRIGTCILVIGMSVVIFATQFEHFIISSLCLGFGMGIVVPGYSAAASLEVGTKEQGAVAGLISSCPATGFIFGPLIGPSLYQLDPQFPYIFNAVLLLILSLYCLFGLKISQQD